MPAIPFDNTYGKLPEQLYTRLTAEPSPAAQRICVNARLGQELGIDPDWLSSDAAVAVFSGSAMAEGAEPLAQAYAGHQFGGYVPQLGDGRALMLGEILNPQGRRFDLQLKGSGRTPYSRGGDGKAGVAPVIREYLVSEAMAQLGVPTTRALAAVTTGETIVRHDGPQPGAILTRVAASHIRIGTFQFASATGDIALLQQLADYTIDRHYPSAADTPQPYQSLLDQVLQAQVSLISHWMALGFIHGVMNTDNAAISGETLDYGPCAFMDTFHPDCVFSSIDSQARYSWGNQANIGLWNLTRFAESLLPLLAEDRQQAITTAEASLEAYQPSFSNAYMARFLAKFGLPATPAAESVLQSGLSLMANQQADFTCFFRELTRIASGSSADHFVALGIDAAEMEAWLPHWQASHSPELAVAMAQVNPQVIPRNHQVEKALAAAKQGDYTHFQKLAAALKDPYSEQADRQEFELPPQPEEVVYATFCGT